MSVIGFFDHGATPGAAILTVAAGTTTGTVTIYPWKYRMLRTQIVIEVDAGASWAGTATITPAYRTTGNTGTVTSVATGQLTGSGTNRVYAAWYTGPCEEITIAVSANNQAFRVYAISYAQADGGAAI